jgi:hypothetical protein
MVKKINIREIKKLIKESKLEEEYRHRFVENFRDVRERDELSEEEIDPFAEALFKEIFMNR